MPTGSARFTSYEQAVAGHRWAVPERYNIVADVCDKHPRERLAMVCERFDGERRDVTWGELQDLAAQAAHALTAAGVEHGDRVAVVLPPSPETAAVFFGIWKLGASLLAMSVLYGDDGIQHRLTDSGASVVVTDRANAPRFAAMHDRVLVLDDGLLDGQPTQHATLDTSCEDPAQLYYTSGTTGLAKGIVHAHRYLLAHNEFTYCHDVHENERFHGMGEWAWAAGIAPLLGPWRLGAVPCVYQREGGFDPNRQLDFLSRHQVTNVFTTPTAMRSMMAIADAGSRYPQQFRVVCSAGEWFRMGDAASTDADGYYWYEGRADDLIIAAGYRIGPFEVESACLEHPAVAEAAVVASPDERRGHVVKAFVVLADGFEPSDSLANEIKAHVRDRLSAYAYPRRIEFIDDLPKTLTGKIRRIELRQAEETAYRGR